jgi:sulfur relay protein TusC/DsrF
MKQLLFIQSQRPGSTITAQESFDALLAGSAFAEVSVLFVGDGVLQLVTPQTQHDAPPRKAFNAGFSAMPDFDIHKIYCCAKSFREKGLAHQALCVRPELVQSDAISKLWLNADSVLCF